MKNDRKEECQNKPAMVTYNDVDYFYVYNLQGDVAALIDADGRICL